jgi:hypothetical protein
MTRILPKLAGSATSHFVGNRQSRRTDTEVNSFLLLGIRLVGLVETPQKIGEATRNGFFQEIAVVAAEGVANACPNGPTNVFFVSWHNFHVRSPARYGTPRR